MPGKYFEQFRVGQQIETEWRSVSEADIADFARVSGDDYPLHMDEEYAATTFFKGRVAHGLLGLSVASGLVIQTRIFDKTLIAFKDMQWRFHLPVRIGDSLVVKLEVAEKRQPRHPDRGVLICAVQLINQKGECVQDGQWTLLIARGAAER